VKELTKILVTGAAGYIGSHLTERLLDMGLEVKVLIHSNSQKIQHLLGNPRLEIMRGDTCIPNDCTEAVKGCDIVIHLAALISIDHSIEHPKTFWDTNVGGTFNMLGASFSEDIDRFIYMSSCEILGNIPVGKADENYPKKFLCSPYAASKYAAEAYCQSYYSAYKFPTVIIRGFNIFGPRQKPGERGAVISTFIKKALENEPLLIYGYGNQIRDYLYVKDVAEALAKAVIMHDVSGEVIHICSGIGRSINEIALKIISICNSDSKPIHLEAKPGEISRSVGDNSKAKKLLKWKPRFSFEEGLKKTVEWFKSNDTN
jgi:nucleoside-diphosphate-sugar epimerase